MKVMVETLAIRLFYTLHSGVPLKFVVEALVRGGLSLSGATSGSITEPHLALLDYPVRERGPV